MDMSNTQMAAPLMLSALKTLMSVRPDNWDDGDDPESEEAWRTAADAIAAAEGATLRCDAIRTPLPPFVKAAN
jgi:hypothetical protein